MTPEQLKKELDKLHFPVHVVPVWQPLGNRPYLFEVPEKTYLTLEEGDKVLCSTKRGEQDGVCASADLWLNREELKALIYACGATLPLKPLVGKYALIRFEDELKKRGMTEEITEQEWKEVEQVLNDEPVDTNGWCTHDGWCGDCRWTDKGESELPCLNCTHGHGNFNKLKCYYEKGGEHNG